MTQATMHKIPGTTPLTEIVSTLRARQHLMAAGIVTLADVRTRGLDYCIKIKYVGDLTMSELRGALGPQGSDVEAAAPMAEPEYGENGMPVLLERTPSGPSHIAFSPADKVPAPGGAGHRVQPPAFIEFDPRNGQARVTARMYFMRKFRRDISRVDAAIDEGREWRNECVKVLRRFGQHGTGFIILTD